MEIPNAVICELFGKRHKNVGQWISIFYFARLWKFYIKIGG